MNINNFLLTKTKYLAVITMMICCCIYSNALGQDLTSLLISSSHQGTFQARNAIKLKDVLNQLRERKEARFLYEEISIEGKTIETPVDYDQPTSIILADILTPLSLTFKQSASGTFVIYPEAPKAATQVSHSSTTSTGNVQTYVASVKEDEIRVTGQVTDVSDGTPLQGVTVVLQGTTEGDLTDENGNYSIIVPDEGAVLVFSYIGYEQVTEPINGRSTINIQMTPSELSLKEVVVVGYGTQRRGDVTAAISNVNMDDVQSIALTSVDQAIQGRVPGVTVTQAAGGAPGGGLQVNIRGIGTINSETPLYVIDGIPIQESGRDQLSSTILNSLNPNDIESIDILKDASAAAIYGSRASGGVVIITTKRGKAGPVRVNFNGYYGVQTQPLRYEVLNADQYVDYINQLHSAPDGEIPQAFAGGQRPPFNTDWQDELFADSPAPIQNYNLDVSGGNENATFSVGLEYFDQQGTMVGSSFERFAIRANSDFKVGKRIKFGESLLLSKTDRVQNAGSGGRRPIEHAIKQAPTVPLRDESFLGGWGWPDTDEGQDAANPIATANLNENNQDAYQVWGSLYGEIEFFEGLTYRLQLGLDFRYQDNFNYNPEYQGVRRLTTVSSLNQSRTQDFNPLLEQYLTYTNTFGRHDISAMLGYSVQEFRFSSVGGRGEELPEGVRDLDAASVNVAPEGNSVETSLRSVFGRISYGFADKYLLTANIRRDESSKLFRSSNPSGVFPSFSAGWWISRESFLENSDMISQLKLRGGWGRLGNQNPLSAFPVDILLPTDFFYPFNNQVAQGISQTELANPDITWEVTEQWDIGLDIGLWDNSLLVNIDYYNRETEDLIQRAAVPPSAGLGPPFVNIGNIRNSGFEFAVTYRKFLGDLSFDISANLTTVNNEVLSLRDEDVEIFSGGVIDDIGGVSVTRVGDPIGTFFGFQSDGIFQSWDDVYSWAFINQAENEARDAETATQHTAPGDIRWVDTNGDGVVNADDRVNLGSPIPDFIYGLTLNMEYKGFDLQAFLQGTAGHQIFNGATRWLEDFRQNFNQGTAYLDRWTPDNPSNSIPRITRADPNQNILRVSDRYVEDGDFLKFRNLTLGYTLGQNVSSKIRATKMRIYGTIQNLAVFTSYGGLEPEIGSLSSGTARDFGIDRLIYPQSRNFIVGVQLGF